MKWSSEATRTACLAELAANVYAHRLYRYLRRVGTEAAEDLMQEVYMKLLQVPLDDLIRDPEGYIFTVARRVLGEFARRESQQRTTVSVDSVQLERMIDTTFEFDDPAYWVSSYERIERMCTEIRPELYAALLLHIEGQSVTYIAQQLEVSYRAARRYVDEGRQSLRRALVQERERATRRDKSRARHGLRQTGTSQLLPMIGKY
jgi:RNA polymerase sigma factor (sigma-70 family)